MGKPGARAPGGKHDIRGRTIPPPVLGSMRPTSENSILKLSEKPHERASLLAIRRLIAT